MLSEGVPTDPLEFTSRLYEATSGPLSAMMRDLLIDDAFLQLSRRLLESWATVESLVGRLVYALSGRARSAASWPSPG